MATLQATGEQQANSRLAMRSRMDRVKQAPLSAKAAAAVLLAGLGYGGYEAYQHNADKAYTPAEARGTLNTGKPVKVRFKVEAVGGTRGGGLSFINSYAYKRGEPQPAGGITVVVQNWKCPGFGPAERQALIGKEVTATGPVTQYNGSGQSSVQVVISDPKDLKVQ
jgi:hypothetical protein